MGIQDLLIELTKRFGDQGVKEEQVFLQAFSGHRLAIDVSIYAHVFMAIARKEAIRYIDPLREDPKHMPMRSYWLERYFNMLIAMLECNITPIAVFDGPHFRLKEDTKEDREKKYAERTAEIAKLRQELREQDDDQKLTRLKMKLEHHITFQDGDWEALEEMMRVMGIPIVKPDTEAEAICARLIHRGYATGAVTRDGDVLAHLAPFMITDIKRSYRHDRPWHTCTVYVLSTILKALDLTHHQFTEFCMLLGTDYNDRIPGFGFVGSLKLMQKHRNIEGCLKEIRSKVEKANAKKKGTDKEDKIINLSDYRLFNNEIREEIKTYFTGNLGARLEHFPVVLYEDGLYNCFDELFMGPNKQRMLDQVPDKVELLRSFNQEFAATQVFVLQEKSNVDDE